MLLYCMDIPSEHASSGNNEALVPHQGWQEHNIPCQGEDLYYILVALLRTLRIEDNHQNRLT